MGVPACKIMSYDESLYLYIYIYTCVLIYIYIYSFKLKHIDVKIYDIYIYRIAVSFSHRLPFRWDYDGMCLNPNGDAISLPKARRGCTFFTPVD